MLLQSSVLEKDGVENDHFTRLSDLFLFKMTPHSIILVFYVLMNVKIVTFTSIFIRF